MQSLSAVQSMSTIQACSAIQACSGITAIPSTESPFTNTYSVDFDGIDDYATTDLINDTNNFDQAFTVSMWVKLDDVSTDQKFFGRYADPGAVAKRFFFGIIGTKLAIGVGEKYDANIDHGLSTGTWYHVAFTYDGSTVTYYRGGSSIGTVTSVTWTTDSSAYACYIGAFNNKGTPQGFTNGKIDEVSVYNSELSSGQISTISASPIDLSSYSPIGWWRMGDNDGGTGTTITDQGSGGNNATLTNGPTFSTDVPT